MAKVDDLPIILEMIKPISQWKYASQIRAADVAMKTKFTNCDTMDTKDLALSSDNIHYNAASMIKIGTISAQRWLNMHYKYSPAVPVICRNSRPGSLHATLNTPSLMLFDLSGRSLSPDLFPRRAPGGGATPHELFIARSPQSGVAGPVLTLTR
jgi:hypothetical protein